MKQIATAFVLAGLLVLGGCKKPQPVTDQNAANTAAQAPATPGQTPDQSAAAAPPDQNTPAAGTPATVRLKDGSRYTGSLVSVNGSQMTFRGDNGATRTFDQQDIANIQYGSVAAAATPAPVRTPTPAPVTPAPVTAAPATTAPVEPPPAAAPPPERPREIVVPVSTAISVRTNETIDAKTGSGQTYSAEIYQDILDRRGNVAIPRGSEARLIVRQARAGKLKANDLVLDMESITVNGRRYQVETADIAQQGKSGVGANKRTGEYVGGGAALGAIIGAIAGHGKGAAIGAASGAAAGAAGQVLTRGSVKVPAESVLTFRLEAPLRLAAR